MSARIGAVARSFAAAIAAAFFSLAAVAQIGGGIMPLSSGGAKIGGVITGGTVNAVPFVNPTGVLAQDPTNFLYTIGTGTLSAPTITATTQFVAPVGASNTAASFSFAGQLTSGFNFNSSTINMVIGGTRGAAVDSGTFYTAGNINIGGSGINTNATSLTSSSTVFTINRTTLISTGASANQMRTAQTTAPTVTVNGGTSPSCVGTDTAMVCTIGTAPPAAATFTVTFNGTWGAAPSCMAIRATTGASPLVQGVVISTTTVVVNLSANLVASEKYNILCFGVS